LKRLAAASLFAFTLNFYTPASHAMPPILPYSEVMAGMQGTAYTVLDTSGEIRTFPVEILGGMEGGKGSQRMIMARTSGDFIEQIIVFENTKTSATFLQYLQSELLVETSVYPVNTNHIMNEIMQEEIVL